MVAPAVKKMKRSCIKVMVLPLNPKFMNINKKKQDKASITDIHFGSLVDGFVRFVFLFITSISNAFFKCCTFSE